MLKAWDLSWVPPEWTSLTFGRDCGLFANYAAEYMTRGQDGVPYSAVMEYMASIIPPDFSPRPTDFQLLEWHEWMRLKGDVPGTKYTEGMPKAQFSCRNQFFKNLTRNAFAANASCTNELCGILESRLDEDLAGIGVSNVEQALRAPS
jgi:hypothetical protein